MYLASENALHFIFSDPHLNLDLRDGSGRTPLHLAVIHYEQAKTLNVIKLLLLEGTSRSAIDADNMKAIDHIEEILDEPTRLRVRKYLQPVQKFTCCRVK